MAVTPEDVHAVAQTMLAPASLVTTVVGDAAQVADRSPPCPRSPAPDRRAPSTT